VVALCHPPAAAWGLEWLEHGTMRARFHQPVYDGASVTSTTLDDPAPLPDPSDWPEVAQVADRPAAAPETLGPGTAFGLAPHGFHADGAGDYLADVREELPLYADEGVAHPGWILRDANYVLSANVRLAVLHLADGAPVARTDHTALYQPRGT
jgi:hypothetical protein